MNSSANAQTSINSGHSSASTQNGTWWIVICIVMKTSGDKLLKSINMSSKTIRSCFWSVLKQVKREIQQVKNLYIKTVTMKDKATQSICFSVLFSDLNEGARIITYTQFFLRFWTFLSGVLLHSVRREASEER